MRFRPFAFAPLFAATFSVAQAAEPALPYTLPARFEAGLIHVEPKTASGVGLRLFTDTGGGLFLATSAADRLGANYELPEDGPPRGPVGTMPWPEFAAETWVPQPHGTTEGIAIMAVPPGMRASFGDADGMLGASWFGGRAWEFDYRNGTLRLMPEGVLADRAESQHMVALGFQKDGDGNHATHFPRITVTIDGEPLELLFDTGATIVATPEAQQAMGDGLPARRGGSFIAQSVAARWRENHPDWQYIEKGEAGTGMALIRAENVIVAGYEVGAVWFALRPDKNFHEFMSQWMDQRVDGALGGGALGSFKVTVDYRSERALFER